MIEELVARPTAIDRTGLDARAPLAATVTAGLPTVAARLEPFERLQPTSALPVGSTAPVGPVDTLAFVHVGAAPAQPGSVPAWANGMRDVIAGPVLDARGLPEWTHVVPLLVWRAVRRGPNGPALAYVRAETSHVDDGPSGHAIAFGPGSIWIVASAFSSTAPADGFAGIAFDTMTLTLAHAPPVVANGDIEIDAGALAAFSLAPMPPVPPVGGTLVNDGAAARVTLPATFAFAIAPSGATVARLDDARLEAYGTSTSLHGGIAAVRYDAAASHLAFEYATMSPATLDVATSLPTSAVHPSGSVALVDGAYRVPVARTTPARLGAVEDGGSLGLHIAPGLLVTFGKAPHVVRLGAGLITARSGALAVVAAAVSRGVVDTYALWNVTPLATPPRAASLSFRLGTDATFASFASGTLDSYGVVGATLDANVDRPVTVGGEPVRYDRLSVDYVFERAEPGAALVVWGAPSASNAFARATIETFALENAVLVTNGLDGLFAFARLEGGRGVSGIFETRAPLIRLLPTLPDPYVASYAESVRAPQGEVLLSRAAWTTPDDANFAFTVARDASAVDTGGDANLPPSPIAERGETYALLDVSSNAGQFGVSFDEQSLFAANVADQTMVMPGASFRVFTLPHIAWEAVVSDEAFDPGTGVTTPQPRSYRGQFSPDDGDATSIGVPTQTLRPVEPVGALAAFVSDYAAGANLDASFTLPFGLIADVDTTPGVPAQPVPGRPSLAEQFTTFGTPSQRLIATAQLRMEGASASPGARRELPGTSSAPPAVASPTSPSYAASMLDATIASLYNQDFAGITVPGRPPLPPRVPVERIDLSGYGASLFSRWEDDTADVGVDQVRFDVIVGRTSYELVQAQSYVLPWFVPVVDTTIFARDAAGYVLRRNSGWVAKAPGTFAFPAGAWTIENGAIVGVFNVRNIRPTGDPTVTASGIAYAPVRFDADVQIVVDPSAHGLRLDGDPPGGLVAATNVVGYLDTSAGGAPKLADAVALLARVAAINAPAAAGSIAARGTIASTGVGMTFTGFDVKATHDGTGIAAALRGTPHLPRDGAWSVTSRGSLATNAAPLDALAAVPRVRARAAPNVWRLANPEDVPSLGATGPAGPRTVYGFVQSTGTQKILLEHPAITDGDPLPLNFKQPVKFADVGSLLGIPGLLPDLGSLLDLDSFTGLVPSGDGFAMQTPGSAQRKIEKLLTIDDRTLIPLGPVSVHLSSKSGAQSTIDVSLDASGSPRWQATITNVAFKLVVDGWGSSDDPLVAVTATVVARDGAAPTLENIAVDYGSALSIVKSVLSGIETFLAFLPGGATGPPFTIDFAGSTLKIRESFALPTLPLGFGFLQDIALDMGFDLDVAQRTIHFFVGVGDDQDPFHWLVSPLSGNGLIQLGATDQLGVKMQAGIGVGLGIDLGIASGSASIVLAVSIDTTQSPMVVMLLLTGNAQVDVLDGLASASLTLTAGVGIGVQLPAVPPADPVLDPIGFVKATVIDLSAEVQVAIHLSLCWVVHIDWSGSWNFSESLSGSTLTSLV